MSSQEFEYCAQVAADYVAVREGRKPLLIVSSGKSWTAYNLLRRLAMQEPQYVDHLTAGLVCEDGTLHMHLFVCLAGAPYASEAYAAILEVIEESCVDHSVVRNLHRRFNLQRKLGYLLGYSAAEIEEFVGSELSLTCPCDCCGSPYTVRGASATPAPAGWSFADTDVEPEVTDSNPGRFTEFAYQY